MMIREKSMSLYCAKRSIGSSVALSSWAVMQGIPLPFVSSRVVLSKASLSNVPEKYTSEQATSHLRILGGRAASL